MHSCKRAGRPLRPGSLRLRVPAETCWVFFSECWDCSFTPSNHSCFRIFLNPCIVYGFFFRWRIWDYSTDYSRRYEALHSSFNLYPLILSSISYYSDCKFNFFLCFLFKAFTDCKQNKVPRALQSADCFGNVVKYLWSISEHLIAIHGVKKLGKSWQ